MIVPLEKVGESLGRFFLRLVRGTQRLQRTGRSVFKRAQKEEK